MSSVKWSAPGFFLLIACGMTFAADLPPGTSCSRIFPPATPGTECWSIVSPYLEGTNAIEVLLPKKSDTGCHHSVVYCLPVSAGVRGEWGHPLTEAEKQGLADRYQAIFVTPSFPILPWYGNNDSNPLCRQNDHVIKAVIPFVTSHYPVNGTNYLIGFSKSALGALSMAMDHRELFSGVAVFENWYGEPDALQWEKWGFSQCYGTRENYDRYDPGHVIPLHASEWSAGPARITVLGGGPGMRTGVDQLMALLNQKGIPHVEIWDRSMGHRWDSGWMPLAAASLFRNRQLPEQEGSKSALLEWEKGKK
jgi:Putative esterase